MWKRAVLACALCGALSGTCTGRNAGTPDASEGASTGPDAGSLVGTWDLMLTGARGSTTVIIGRDSLSITSGFTLSASRTANVMSFTDNQTPTDPSNAAVLAATQTRGTFNAGIVPFDLSGSWTMEAGPKGGKATVSCTLTVTAAEIDGACQFVSPAGPPAGPWFTFTTQKMNPAASSFGDLGGKWINTWIWPGMNGGTFPCTLDFAGKTITTCAGGALNGQVNGSPLAGITFTYDGANTVSGAAHGWAEFFATR
jgi:hypothetical protein